MGKLKPLGHIYLDQNRLHVNRSLPNEWHAIMIRTPFAGESYIIDYPELPTDYFLIRKEDLDYEALIFPFGDKLALFAPDQPDYSGQCVAILVGPVYETLIDLQAHINILPELGQSPRQFSRKLYKNQQFIIGDPLEAMAVSKRKVESNLHIRPYPLQDFENRDILANYQDDMLTMDISHPWIHQIRTCVAEATGLPQHKVLVRAGISYQLKQFRLTALIIPACLAAICSKFIGKPVRFHMSAAELLRYGSSNLESKFRITSGHSEDGEIQALRVYVEIDAGAYPLGSEEIIKQTIACFLGTYYITNIEFKIQIYASNHAPRTFQGGFGEAAAQLALERHWGLAIKNTTETPVSFRLSHLRYSHIGPKKLVFDDTVPEMQKALSKLTFFSDFNRRFASNKMVNDHLGYKEGIRKGIGLSIGYQPCNLIHFERSSRIQVELELSEDGQLEIFAPLEPGNMSVRDGWNFILSKFLDIEERNISYHPLTTETYPDPGPLILGRQFSIVSKLLAEGARMLKDGMSGGNFPLRITSQRAPQQTPFFNLANFEGNPFVHRTWGSAACELEVCLDRGLIQIKKIWLAVYIGAIFKESRVRAILEASAKEAAKLCVDHNYAQGARMNLGAGSHITNKDKIEINLSLLQNEDYIDDSIESMNLVNGIESIAFVLIPPAFLNALQQAIGKAVSNFPPVIEDIFEEAKHEA